MRFKETVTLHFSCVVVQMVKSFDRLKPVRFKETADILFKRFLAKNQGSKEELEKTATFVLQNWNLSVAEIEKKKKKLRVRETFSSPTHSLQGELQRGG